MLWYRGTTKIPAKEALVKSETDSQNNHSMDSEARKQRTHLRTWSQIGRLAQEALDAFDAGKPRDARERMKAIYGLASNADQAEK